MLESRSFKVTRAIVLSLITLMVALPLYVLVISSFKSLADVSGPFQWWPSNFSFDAYVTMWSTVPLAQYLLNSLIVVTIATAVGVGVAILAAFAVSRLRWRGQRPFSLVILVTQMVPGILFLLPLYLMYTELQQNTGVQLNGSYIGLIITYMTFAVPFSTWMLIGFFAAVPEELEEAAMLDGTTRLGAFFRVVLPVVRPGIIAVTIFAFISGWGEVLFASVLTTTETRTLAIGLQGYAGLDITRWNELMAASILSSLPLLIAFLVVQRNIVQGLASGSVK